MAAPLPRIRVPRLDLVSIHRAAVGGGRGLGATPAAIDSTEHGCSSNRGRMSEREALLAVSVCEAARHRYPPSLHATAPRQSPSRRPVKPESSDEGSSRTSRLGPGEACAKTVGDMYTATVLKERQRREDTQETTRVLALYNLDLLVEEELWCVSLLCNLQFPCIFNRENIDIKSTCLKLLLTKS